MVTNNSCDYQPTQYNVQTGGASGTLNNVAPSATSGVPVISQGSSSQPIFGTAVVAGGGTGNTSATAYALLAGGTTSTGAHQSLATGTSGQILQSGGSGALPTWINNSASGNLVLIQSQTASSSASIAFTTGITSTYNNYLLLWSNVAPGTNSTVFEMQVSTNGGSSYIATNYKTGIQNIGYANSTWANVNQTTFVNLGQTFTNSAGDSSAATFWMLDVTTGVNIKFMGTAELVTGAVPTYEVLQGYNTASTINAFKVLFSSGNISTGTFTLYGILE